jgi:glycosyltransferase involved in cell wall biosynthesis
MKKKLSVIIIAKNEEKNIGDCLDSISWADEIILVDDHSDDDTDKIIKLKNYKNKIKVFKKKMDKGFGDQKNFALKQATSDWVLSIDCDERVTQALADEIKFILKNAYFDAYYIERESYYCGYKIKFSGWRNDFVLRLFKKEKAEFSDRLVHEKVIDDNLETEILKNKLIHKSFDTYEQVLKKINFYSTLSALEMHKNKKTVNFSTILLKTFSSFFKTFVLKLGFLDGKAGFMLAISNAEGVYYKYLKLFFLNRK